MSKLYRLARKEPDHIKRKGSDIVSENTNANALPKGTPLWRLSKKFQFAADQIIPDSFVFCLILTFIVFIVSLILTDAGPINLVRYWWDGLSTQNSFAFQMSLMVIVCATCAKAPQVKRIMVAMSRLVRTPTAAMILLMAFGYVSSFVNWAFCTIVTPILAMQLAKNIKGLHFPMMIAAGYSCMILGQCLGPSASLYALLATPGHFLEAKMGVLTQDITVYNPMNVTLFVILAVAFVLLAIFTRPPKHELVEFNSILDDAEISYEVKEKVTLADKMNASRIFMWLIGLAGIIAIVYSFATKGVMGSLSVNFIIYLFVTINCFLYSSPRAFIEAHKDNMRLACEVMLQFPFYGGIMGIMNGGLGAVIVGGIVSVATAQSLPVWSFISASIVNLFIPSQGGQWIVQGPLLIDAAEQLGANMVHVANAFVYGDECTNLLQPLYVIPALAVVGMKLKDVWGFMAFICVFWALICGLGLYFIPMFI